MSSSLGSDVLSGLKQGALFAGAVLVLTLPPPGLATSRAARSPAVARSLPVAHLTTFHGADFGAQPVSDDVRFVADWASDSGDSRGLPFVILDKRDARVFVFAPTGALIDSSPVLLGAAPGDDPAEGIGTRPMALVRPEEKTTPAGRFVGTPGKNASGEEVFWVDYADAVSMHRVRPVDPKERRLERLASPDPSQRRISYGCINVPVAFFESVVWPLLSPSRAVVYVLPETRDVREVFAQAYTVATKPPARPTAVANM